MGGRRSYSLKDVLGTNKKIGQKKAQLTESFNNRNLTGVSEYSANLVAEHRDIGKIFLYSKKLLSAIKGSYKPEEIKNLKEISKRIRIDWSDIKSKEKLVSNSIIDSAVIDSVGRVLKEIK